MQIVETRGGYAASKVANLGFKSLTCRQLACRFPYPSLGEGPRLLGSQTRGSDPETIAGMDAAKISSR